MAVGRGVGGEVVGFLAPVRGVGAWGVVGGEEVGVAWECVLGFRLRLRGGLRGRAVEPERVIECHEDLVIGGAGGDLR